LSVVQKSIEFLFDDYCKWIFDLVGMLLIRKHEDLRENPFNNGGYDGKCITHGQIHSKRVELIYERWVQTLWSL